MEGGAAIPATHRSLSSDCEFRTVSEFSWFNSPPPTAVAERTNEFNVQLFGGRWDGRWYFRMTALPKRIIIPDSVPEDEDRELIYVRAEWDVDDYNAHDYMRYNLKDGGYYGCPYQSEAE